MVDFIKLKHSFYFGTSDGHSLFSFYRHALAHVKSRKDSRGKNTTDQPSLDNRSVMPHETFKKQKRNQALRRSIERSVRCPWGKIRRKSRIYARGYLGLHEL